MNERKHSSEPLNINSVLRVRSKTLKNNSAWSRETTVLSICCGKDDVFTKTALEWLHKARCIKYINVLLCGPVKSLDAQLHQVLQQNESNNNSSSGCSSKAAENGCSAQSIFRYKQQTNMPSEAQWEILQPAIVTFGLHLFTERWSAKNCPNDLLWGDGGTAAEEQQEEAGSGTDADSEKSDDKSGERNPSLRCCSESSGRKRKRRDQNRKKSTARTHFVAAAAAQFNEKSRRPTVYHTEVYRRAMLVQCLALIAKYRPKTVFIQNIVEPTKQAERRRKDEKIWQQMIDIVMAFGSEAAYRVRPFGLDMREDEPEDDAAENDYPRRRAWCNSVLLERIDNGYETVSSLYYETAQCDGNSKQQSAQVCEALRWLIYDKPVMSTLRHNKTRAEHALHENFYTNCAHIFAPSADESEDELRAKKRRKCAPTAVARKRKSVTNPAVLEFPAVYAKALAHYCVAQVLASL